MAEPLPLTLGTAGHIDHGKTALVRALTGVDTDRLPAERSRGISIELGYAPLELPSGRRGSVVDVPGHERFVRTMVAGATGIDLFLMAIAADDGVMPQTREHAVVLAGLGVQWGVVAVTKADLVDPAAALEEAARLLPDAPAVAVSTATGRGVADLVAQLDRVAAAIPGRAARGEGAPVRLHVDRAFTIHGAGTVATGTLWSGAIGVGDDLAVLAPGASGRERATRVRAVHVHDRAVARAAAGQRVALNLGGIPVAAVPRGSVVASPGRGPREAHVLDVMCDDGPARRSLQAESRVQVHHGTRESPARVSALGGHFFQLRLERPLAAWAGDRMIVRRIAPPDTLGGAVVLDPAARRHGPSRDVLARLERLARGEPEPPPPPAPAPPPEPPAPPLTDAARALERRLAAAGARPPSRGELGELAVELPALRARGRAVRVGASLDFHPAALDEVRRVVMEHLREHGSITVAALRDRLGTSRRYAQALLEHFDAERTTRRAGDEHVLRRGR